jgi:hypothetical protein
MTFQQLARLHDQRPFKPFVIRLADGRSLRVRHPEMLARPAQEGRTVTVYDNAGLASIVDLLLVVSLDEEKRNGRPRPRGRRSR